MKSLLSIALLLLSGALTAQPLLTPFEKSGGKETATYAECMDFYNRLDQSSLHISIRLMGQSDAGLPYHLVLYSRDGQFDPARWHAANKLVMLVINDIHPGEPDGVDASMMLLRDLASGKTRIPDNIAIAVIPIYNIGGALNRNRFSRVNQDGPASYGFRGNAQNLDLNRDFTKCDSRDARSFAEIFQWLGPDLQLDNHVSDGADYQHTMTLISTQWNKLGGRTGTYLHDQFVPQLFTCMDKAGWPLCPYVNSEGEDPRKGWDAFLDYPRYSSGYAALFHVLSFISETHMLKPYPDRVKATYALMQAMISAGSAQASLIRDIRRADIAEDQMKNEFALKWIADSTRADTILFRGYAAEKRISSLTGQPRLFYNHGKPYEERIPYYDYFDYTRRVQAPAAYLIPQGWHEVTDLLKLNGVKMQQLKRDTIIQVQVYRIEDYKSMSRPYEKHHRNYDVKTSSSFQTLSFRKGDFLIPTEQDRKRFIIEMLEPTGDDSYFAWNFFDAILQQKEGYSDYRWEDVAEKWVNEHPEVREALEAKKAADPAFAANAVAQLEFVYKRSPYYEPEHMRYPVFRIISQAQNKGSGQ